MIGEKIWLEDERRGGGADGQKDGYHMLICLVFESIQLHKLGLLEKPGGSKGAGYPQTGCV